MALVSPEPMSGCWLWTGALASNGYGNYRIGRTQRAHRVSWALHNGPITDGLHVLHHCDNRACVNPAHLYLGRDADNNADMMKRDRHHKLRGSQQAAAKLNEDDVLTIKRALAGGVGAASLARRYGVTTTAVCHIKNGVTWAWLEVSP